MKKKFTFKQLEKFAKKLYVPFGYLFLKKPPHEELPITFYRTVNDSKKKIDINLYDMILHTKRQQEWLSEYLIENGNEKLDFVGKYNLNTDYQIIVKDIRQTLGLNYEWSFDQQSWENALEYFSNKVNEKGIIVIYNSIVLFNVQRKIKVEDC